MRDLRSRLRDVVRRDHGGGAGPATAARELTYVPDAGGLDVDAAHAAAALGGTVIDAGRGGCIVIDRVWRADEWHGRRAVGAFAPEPDAPLALFDAGAARDPSWAERIVFFDLETTGLSGGAGTLPFLAGCGWFEADAFRVRQFFLAAPSGEKAMLQALAGVLDDASLLVTYNGRTFDVPLMETRWAFHRAAAATDDLPHFDMLPSARRLWGRRSGEPVGRGFSPGGPDPAAGRGFSPGRPEPAVGRGFSPGRPDPAVGRGFSPGRPDDRASCSLSALERSVLGFHRLNDVPGFEIPARYFHFLRTGDAAAIAGVLDHNRHDLLSLAGVMAQALWMAREGADVCREASEQLGLGRLFERAGQVDRAVRAYELAARDADGDVRVHALARLAAIFGRRGRHDEAAAAWQGIVDDARARRGPWSALERRAMEALAIHHEHRARDLPAARGYAAELHAHAAGQARQDVAHRLARLTRKMAARGRLL